MHEVRGPDQARECGDLAPYMRRFCPWWEHVTLGEGTVQAGHHVMRHMVDVVALAREVEHSLVGLPRCKCMLHKPPVRGSPVAHEYCRSHRGALSELPPFALL